MNFYDNYCGCSGSENDIMVNWVKPLFLKAKAASTKADYPIWCKATSGTIYNEYWKTDYNLIIMLEGIESW